MKQWSFVQDTSGAWCWWGLGGDEDEQSSDYSFATLADAMHDAEQHGFLSGNSRLGEIIRREPEYFWNSSHGFVTAAVRHLFGIDANSPIV